MVPVSTFFVLITLQGQATAPTTVTNIRSLHTIYMVLHIDYGERNQYYTIFLLRYKDFVSNELHCCCLVVKLCTTLHDPMDQSTPGPPVFHCLPELGQIHAGSFDYTVQPSCPLSSPSISIYLF